MDRRSHCPIALRNMPCTGESGGGRSEGPSTPSLFPRTHLQPIEIAERLMPCPFVDLDIAQLHRRIALDHAVGCGLRTTCALMTVSCGTSMTRSPESGPSRTAAARQAIRARSRNAAPGTNRRDMVVGRNDLVLGELLPERKPCNVPQVARPHRRFDINSKRTCGIEDRRPDGERPRLPEGMKSTTDRSFRPSRARSTFSVSQQFISRAGGRLPARAWHRANCGRRIRLCARQKPGFPAQAPAGRTHSSFTRANIGGDDAFGDCRHLFGHIRLAST